jgi:hypothetical protein
MFMRVVAVLRVQRGEKWTAEGREWERIACPARAAGNPNDEDRNPKEGRKPDKIEDEDEEE